MKHKDLVIADIMAGQIVGKFLTFEQSNQVDLDFREFRFRFKADKGLEELGVKSDYINIQPIRPKSLSMFKAQKFEFTNISCHGNDSDIIKNMQLLYKKC